MRVTSLYDETIEPQMKEWLDKHETALNALNNIHSIFASLKKNHIEGELDEFVSIEGPVHIGKGSRIHSNVSIQGPVIIGENVSIRSQSQIRNHAFIASDCVVGHSADIKRSICLNGAKMQDGTFVGDSVLGVGARVGSGAILANRKFNQTNIALIEESGDLYDSGRDFLGTFMGKYSRLGANVVMSPGTILGEYSWVGSGICLSGTHAADLLITTKQELEIRPKDRVSLVSGRGEYEHI